MLTDDIIKTRLYNQQLSHPKFKRPQQLVEHLVAMQAQEYAMAKWSIGLRLPSIHDADIDDAFNKGQILRTHLLRPTWHFVAPKDIRWLLTLTAPRVRQVSSFMFRKMELTDAVFKKSNLLFEKMLTGGNHLTRTALKTGIDKAGISTTEFRMGYILMNAELDGLLCSGHREGNQFTYALLEERVAPAKSITHEESLAELSRRYFMSRGPATIQDFVTWSGLTVKDAREALSMTRSKFESEKIDGKEYFFSNISRNKATEFKTFLMPDYDEYGMSYKDRSAIFNSEKLANHISRGNPVFNRMIIIDGKIEGTWNRTITKSKVEINTFPFSTLNKEQKVKLKNAEVLYRSFLS